MRANRPRVRGVVIQRRRLLGNAQVTPSAIAAGGFQATAALAAQPPGDWWAVEDSTTLTSAHGVVEALGDWGGKAPARGRGLIVHSVLLLAADHGRTRGLREQSRWQRAVSARGTRQVRAERAKDRRAVLSPSPLAGEGWGEGPNNATFSVVRHLQADGERRVGRGATSAGG